MKNKYLLTAIIAVAVGAVSFYAGIKYQESRRPAFSRQFGNVQGLRGGQLTGGQNRGEFRPVNGEIIASDDNSITVKLQDGTSKIIILSEKTQINKASEVARTELKTGERVAVFGTQNSDQSISAQNIQLNPMSRGMSNNNLEKSADDGEIVD